MWGGLNCGGLDWTAPGLSPPSRLVSVRLSLSLTVVCLIMELEYLMKRLTVSDNSVTPVHLFYKCTVRKADLSSGRKS